MMKGEKYSPGESSIVYCQLPPHRGSKYDLGPPGTGQGGIKTVL